MAAPHGIGLVHPPKAHPLHCPIGATPPTRHASSSKSSWYRWDLNCCSHAFSARHIHRCVHAPHSVATTGVRVKCASSASHAETNTGTAQHAASLQTVGEELENGTTPITAATAAAQASTAHGLAVQAASAAQEVSSSKVRSGVQSVAGDSVDDVRPKRDAFSKRDTLSPSSMLPHDATDPSMGSASSSRSGLGSRRIRERLRKDTVTQQPPAHQQPESQQSSRTDDSSMGRLADLAEASGSGSLSGYGSSDDHHQDFSDLLTPDEVLISTSHD